MRQPSRLLAAILVFAQILSGGAAFANFVDPRIAGLCVLLVAAVQGGMAAYQQPPDLTAARTAVRTALREQPLVINGDDRRTRLDADVRTWDAVHKAFDAAGLATAANVVESPPAVTRQ